MTFNGIRFARRIET